jgi:hypothetical protein
MFWSRLWQVKGKDEVGATMDSMELEREKGECCLCFIKSCVM